MDLRTFDELVKKQNRDMPRREYSGVKGFDDEVQRINKTVLPPIVKTPPKIPVPTPPVPNNGPSFLKTGFTKLTDKIADTQYFKDVGVGLAAMEAEKKSPVVPDETINPFSPKHEVLRQAPPESFTTKVLDFVSTPFKRSNEEQKQRNTLVKGIFERVNQDLEKPEYTYDDIDKNFDNYTKALGIRSTPTLKETADVLFVLPVVSGLVANPLTAVLGVAGFMALSEAESFAVSKVGQTDYRFGEAKGVADLLPSQTNELTKNAVEVLDFMAKAKALHVAYKKYPALQERFTKDLEVKYNIPRKVYLEPSKIRSIFQTGEEISPAELDIYKSLGRTGEQIKQDIRNGVSIEIPAEKITIIKDKPYWAKVKSFFKIKPETKVTVTLDGKPAQTDIRGNLPGPSGEPLTVPVVPPITSPALPKAEKAPSGTAQEIQDADEPFAITPTVKDRTPFAITPTQPAPTESFIPKEDIVETGRRLELINEDINQKIQEKVDDLMDNVYNNNVAFKEQALAEAKKYVRETLEMEGKAISRPEMIVSKTQLKDMLAGLEQDIIEMKVILKDDKKYLYLKKDGNNILLRPSALGLVEENIKIGDFLKMDIAKLKPKGTSVRAVDSSGGVMASKGSQPMSKFEQRTTNPEKSVADSFKLYEKVNQMIKKYAERVGEGYLPRGAKGVYYHGTTRNIRLTSMNELSLAAHEVSHYIDEQFNITNKLMAITGYSKNGKPIYDSATSKERKELTSLYERYYPGAKGTHKLSKRMAEGFATLVQKYVEMPTAITQNYPNLVNSILKPEGAFYNPTIGEMIRDLGQIVEDYQALSPLDQIGAVVTSDKNQTGKESFLNFWQKVRTEVADEIYPIEVLAGRAGVGMTVNDPSLWMRMYGLSSSYITNNLTGNRGFWRLKGTDLVKTNDSNWKTLLKRLDKEKTFDSFGHYLVARDQHFQFQTLGKLKEKADQLKRALKNAPEDAVRELEKIANEAQKAYEELKVVLDKNKMSEATVTKAFKENVNRFKEETELHDQLVREDIEFSHDDAVGLLSDEKYKKFISTEGYASLKKEIYDDILGDAEVSSGTSGGKKVSSFRARTGSSKVIIHPVLNAIQNHAEITKKGLRQVVYNSIGRNIARQFPDLFQIQQLQVEPDKNTGGFIFPQEKDPNIIMAIINGKKVPILTDKYVKGIVDDVLSFYDMHILEKVLTVMSRVFTKGTTAAYPQFLLANVSMDTVSSAIQTQTKMIPLISATKEFYKALSNSKSEEAQLLTKYLVSGGDRQTMVGYQSMSANELVAAVTKEREGLLRVIDFIDKGVDILSIPSKYSEIFTRGTEYIRSAKQGNPHIVALEHAGRVSAPFHHIGRLGGGRVGKTAVKTVPFFNPVLQVLDQQARIFETPEGRKRAYFGMAILAALMTSGAAAVMMYGSEKQKRMLSDMDPKEMGMYMYYPNLDGDTLGKVRLPENWAWLGGLMSMAATDIKLKAHYSAVEYLEGATTWIPNQFKVWQFSEWIFSVLPQAVKTPTLLASGKKDFPRVMDIESQGQLNKEPGLRYTDSTSALAKWMGKEFNLSPLKTDALITGILGRASGYVTMKPSAYSISSSLNRTEYFDSGRAMQLYYETKKENDLKTKSVKKRLREFTPEEKAETLRLDNVLSQIDSLVTDYRDIDEEKYPERAEKIKQNIYNLINEKLRGEKTDEPLSAKEQPSRLLSFINNVLGGETAEAAEIPEADKVSVKDLKFSENGVPYFWKDKKATDIDKITIEKKPVTPINSIKITDPRPRESHTITDPAKLKVAEQIASISNAIAPEYTNYLLRIALYEGTLNPKAFNDKGNNLGGVDQGLFQINTKAFPQITKAQAEDVQFSTLWAIALIQAGKQHKWNADKLIKGKVKLEIK